MNFTGKCEVLDISNGSFSEKENETNDLHSVLYVKDKFSISNQAFHELAMVAHGLPKSSRVKKLADSINSEFKVFPTPNGIVGMQQSLWARITVRLTSLIKKQIFQVPSG